MEHQPSIIVLAFVSVLLLLTVNPLDAARSVPRDGGGEPVWMKKNKHLLLPSLQRKTVSPPAANPGTNNAVNSATLGEKSFVATSSAPGSLRKHVLLPSLWKPVAPPSPNPGTNSALVGAMNFVAGLLPRKTTSNNLLLPSLQWRPVTPPSTNPGHNSIGTVGQQNYAGGKTAPPSIHHQTKLPLSQTANC